MAIPRYEEILIARANVHDDIEREMMGWRSKETGRRIPGRLAEALKPDMKVFIEDPERALADSLARVQMFMTAYYREMLELGKSMSKLMEVGE